MTDQLTTRLRFALLKFGQHHEYCPKRPCSCGFLEEWRAAELPKDFEEVMRISSLKELPAIAVDKSAGEPAEPERRAQNDTPNAVQRVVMSWFP